MKSNEVYTMEFSGGGFSLGGTIESKTKGIWIWARVHPIYKDRYLLLLDTEGLGDVYKVS